MIYEDGVVPRFISAFKESANWDIFEQPLIDDSGYNCWEEVFTPDVVEKLRETEQEIAFAQNYLLKPFATGQKIIGKDQILHRDEWSDSAPIIIGVDPAFSLKTNTDALAVVVSAHDGEERYVIDAFAFEGVDKETSKVVKFIMEQYNRWGAHCINIETNNGGEIIGRMLAKEEAIVNYITADRDKVSRLRAHEWRFGTGKVFFCEGTEELQRQLVAFPSKGVHDDLVDAMVYSFEARRTYAVA